MTTTLEGVRGQRHAPAAFYPRERTGTHFTGGWMGQRTGLDRCGKSRPLPGFDPQTFQPVASCYTDCAIPAHSDEVLVLKLTAIRDGVYVLMTSWQRELVVQCARVGKK